MEIQNCSELKQKMIVIKELNNRTEEHDHEIILKPLEIDNDCYRKKCRNLKKKILLIIIETVIGSASTLTSSTLSIVNPSAGNIISSTFALITSIAILIANGYLSKLINSVQLRDWIHIISLLYEKTLQQSMIDKTIDDEEVMNLKKFHNQFLDKRSEIMKNNQFKVENIFGYTLVEESISPEQITKLSNF